MPVSPAPCDKSHSRIASASSSASAEVSTRKVMLHAHLLQKFLCGSMASCPHVFVTTADSFCSFLKIAEFSLEEGCEGIVERISGIFAVQTGEFFELRPALRFERDQVQLGLACTFMIQRDSLSAKHYLKNFWSGPNRVP